MSRTTDLPLPLQPYRFYGVEFDYTPGKPEALGECPWCGAAGKFSIAATDGQWRCFACNEGSDGKSAYKGGNVYTFIRVLHQRSQASTHRHGYEELARDRGLHYWDTLDRWGVCVSGLSGEWLVPGYAPDGKLNNLYRYVQTGKGMRLFSFPGGNQQLFGVLGVSGKDKVYVCEGPWDGTALWEYVHEDADVVSVPGCGVFNEQWVGLFHGKDVVFMYDNDHPRKHPQTGQLLPPPGHQGMQRAVGVLAAYGKPKSISYLKWRLADDVMDHEPDLPDGCDIRDVLTERVIFLPDNQRESPLDRLLSRVKPVPASWLAVDKETVKAQAKADLECLPCVSYDALTLAWRKALKWIDGLDRALSCMLAGVVSTPMVGDQLWFKIIGPPACGKSTLCEAVSVCKQYVVAKSTIRGFHSGFQGKGHGEDNSLVHQIKGKTLVTKDGDTLLQSPNLGQILSEARDLYDSTSRTHYRNKTSRDYSNVRMTWLLCGTRSLRSIDSSDLGERFLDCVIMEQIDDDLEDEILWRKANAAERDVGVESNGQMESQYGDALGLAMRLTGGYVQHLRTHGPALIKAVQFPVDALRHCTVLGKYVAHMRARPSDKDEEGADREFATRLVSQLVRLAKCLAVVLNRQTVDEEVMRRVERVALDTARGVTVDIVARLYAVGMEGALPSALAVWCGLTTPRLQELLRFMRRLNMAETYSPNTVLRTPSKWRLTQRMTRLYREVMKVDRGQHADTSQQDY